MIRIIKIWMGVLLVLATSQSLQAKKVRLKYNFEKGTVFSYEYIITHDITQKVMGQSQSTHSVTTKIMKFHVIDIDSDANYRIISNMIEIKAKLSSPNGDMEFNSNDIRNGDGALKLLQWILDDSVTFVMSPQGDILSVESPEVLITKFEKFTANAGPEAQMLASIGSQFRSEEAILQSISMYFFKFPKERVKVGKPWEDVLKDNQIISFNNSMIQTVTEIKPGSVILSQQTKIEQANPDANSVVQGMTMKYKLSGSKEATYEFDSANGLTNMGESTSSINGVMSIESPQLQVPMSIPMTLKKQEKLTLLR